MNRELVAFEKAVVVVDPGHAVKYRSGRLFNGGARGPSGLLERDAVLDIGERLASSLTEDGIETHLTRTVQNPWRVGKSQKDDNIARGQFANSLRANIFVRIHCDSRTDPNDNGTATWIFRENSRRLAEEIVKSVASATGLKNRGVFKHHEYGLEAAKMPAVTVECCFISNPDEERKLKDSSFRQKIAIGISEGIRKYLKRSDEK